MNLRAGLGFATPAMIGALCWSENSPTRFVSTFHRLSTAALTCQILHMGIPVQLEKPPGLTVTEVDAMIAAADQTGTPNQVAFNRRYTPLLVRLRTPARSPLRPRRGPPPPL